MDYENEKLNFLNETKSIKTYRYYFENSINELKHLKFNIGKTILFRIFFCLLILIIILFRGHFFCLFGFINCYVTWPFSSPVHIKLDLLNLSTKPSQHEYIPRRMHHILLGPLSQSPPESWLTSRNSCIELHSKFEKHYYWTDENSKEFLEKNYSWFLKTWFSYKTIVQKADALRYFLLHYYGGIFLDMDLYCLHKLDGLFNYLDDHVSADEHIFLAVKAFPVGISNGFMISTRNHPLLQRVIENLELYNRNFLLPHATIVISAGPMCISIQIQLNRSLWSSILVLDGKENMIGGKTDTPLFKHLGSGSWHKADDMIFKNIPMNIQRQNQTFSISVIVFIIFIFLFFIGRNKNFIKKMKLIGIIKNISRNIKYYRVKKEDEEDSINLVDSSNENENDRDNEKFRLIIRLIRRISLCFIIRCVLFIPLVIYFLIVLTPIKNLQSFIPIEIKQTKNFLIVVAHPDDECLFFSPTILRLISDQKLGHILVLSTGNSNGLGPIREKELKLSCQQLGIDLTRCLSLNLTDLQDNPKHWWPQRNISEIVETYIKQFQIDLLITFDKSGISGHINHKSIALGIKYYIDNTDQTPLTYEVSTASLLFKFSSLFDILRTTIKFLPRLFRSLFSTLFPFIISQPNDKHVLFVSSPYGYYKGLKAFHAHRSQVLWFRHLYTTFSRYMFMNDLNKISLN
ncbi:unnamed protein product [Rotaria socialis]|uniref:N-acetylglucosaminylphosphatidylinositol deacetylase n=2 Tax=Rotaria socialis TaxID=392032 RepID=A0A820UIN6_9BILA|nr:unnamed protein product [Rotaria socialis]